MTQERQLVEGTLEVREHVLLAAYTTLSVGGPARWFATATGEAEVQAAVRFARQRALPLFVLGGGSNLLVSDAGFDGFVVHLALKGVEVRGREEGGTALVTAAAGEDWDGLVQFTVERNLQGMECLAGIPGSVGGTPVQNVGAYGQEIAQTFVTARCLDTELDRIVDLSKSEMEFGYRTSVLNARARGRYIVLAVTFALTPGGAPTLDYADLKRAFPPGSTPSLLQVAEEVRGIRRGKGMVIDAADPDSRSAGSFFRNPIVPEAVLEQVANTTGVAKEAVPHWPADKGRVKLSAAWLLERAGFVRGTVLGSAGISSKHTLALVNRGGATAAEVLTLRDRIVNGVRERFGIKLEQEPVNVG